jgi:hypothetical protein
MGNCFGNDGALTTGYDVYLRLTFVFPLHHVGPLQAEQHMHGTGRAG